MNGMIEKMKSSPHSKKSKVSVNDSSESEEIILEKKLQMKTQALLILSQDLDQCRMQRDRFRQMAEQLQEDLDRRKELESSNGLKSPSNLSTSKTDKLEEDTKLMDLLIEAKEKNKCLQLQVDTLRQKLKEAQDDNKALRSRKNHVEAVDDITPEIHQREELVEQLEQLHVKCKQLKVDLQAVIDEKQELEMERDAYKCKAHRLNHELSKALNASAPVDVDSLVNENRYLQERIQQLLEEKDLAKQSAQKYKGMLDSKRQKGTIQLGANATIGSVMNFKQVEQLLKQGTNIPPHKTAAALEELHSVCTALLEALNDKSLALLHQKKANKILAARICEIDNNMQSPSMKLLEGYTGADVDTRCDSSSLTSDLSEERSEEKISDENDVAETDSKSNTDDASSKTYSSVSRTEVPNTAKNLIEESQCKSVPYKSGNSFAKYNYKESLESNLPAHLRNLVLKSLEDLKSNDKHVVN